MSKGRIVSFRVAEEHYQLLQSRSANGGSPGSYARELMLQSLHAEQLVQGVERRLDSQELQMAELRKDLRNTLRVVLLVVGRLAPEQASEWVQKALGR
jgi:hypothetical protein